jgi:hypothetical protein
MKRGGARRGRSRLAEIQNDINCFRSLLAAPLASSCRSADPGMRRASVDPPQSTPRTVPAPRAPASPTAFPASRRPSRRRPSGTTSGSAGRRRDSHRRRVCTPCERLLLVRIGTLKVECVDLITGSSCVRTPKLPACGLAVDHETNRKSRNAGRVRGEGSRTLLSPVRRGSAGVRSRCY